MRPQPLLGQCTAFLYREENGDFKPIGSGVYLIVVEGEYIFCYLVTCKHVVKDWLDTNEEVYSRLNRSDQPTGVRYKALDGDWYFHPDDAVDLAVLHMEPTGEPLEITSIDAGKLFTKERAARTGHDIGEGDEVFFAGLFRPYHGHERNLAMYRFGRIALLTEEDIAGPYGESNYLLLEIMVFPFNSGSPLFAVHMTQEGRPAFSVIGIVSGFFPEREEVRVDELGQIVNFTHLGVSTAIPAERVKEILDMPEVVKARKDKLRAGRNRDKQVPAGGMYHAPDSFTKSDMGNALRKVSRPDGEAIIEKEDQASSGT